MPDHINHPFGDDVDLEEWFQVLEASAVGFWQWHVPTGAIRLSRCAADLLGSENCAMHLEEVFAGLHPEEMSEIRGTLEEAATHRNQINVEFRAFSRHDASLWLRLRGGFRAEPERATQFYGLLADVTEQKQTQQHLQELQTDCIHKSHYLALQETASLLAHELNQPLAAVVNYLQGCRILLDSGQSCGASAILDAVEQATDQALRAGEIIRNLREFLAHGEGDYKIENLSGLIDQASAVALKGTARNPHRRLPRV